MSGRYLLVGLGNPGPEYRDTRHNAGFWLVDAFADKYQGALSVKTRFLGDVGQLDIAGHRWIMLKPNTFMNRSGLAVRKVLEYYDVELKNILVVHDELDFDSGLVRYKRDGGHGGHNGLRDMVAQLGSNDFARLRIGIGRGRGDVANYVLSAPSKQQRAEINLSISNAVDLLPDLMGANAQQAIMQLHQP